MIQIGLIKLPYLLWIAVKQKKHLKLLFMTILRSNIIIKMTRKIIVFNDVTLLESLLI